MNETFSLNYYFERAKAPKIQDEKFKLLRECEKIVSLVWKGEGPIVCRDQACPPPPGDFAAPNAAGTPRRTSAYGVYFAISK